MSADICHHAVCCTGLHAVTWCCDVYCALEHADKRHAQLLRDQTRVGTLRCTGAEAAAPTSLSDQPQIAEPKRAPNCLFHKHVLHAQSHITYVCLLLQLIASACLLMASRHKYSPHRLEVDEVARAYLACLPALQHFVKCKVRWRPWPACS